MKCDGKIVCAEAAYVSTERAQPTPQWQHKSGSFEPPDIFETPDFSLCKAHNANSHGAYLYVREYGFAASNTAERKINKHFYNFRA